MKALLDDIMNWNTYDLLIIIVLLLFAFATGIKDGDKPVVPKPITIRTGFLLLILLLVMNIGGIIDFFTK